jgi:hypothetical protein
MQGLVDHDQQQGGHKKAAFHGILLWKKWRRSPSNRMDWIGGCRNNHPVVPIEKGEKMILLRMEAGYSVQLLKL